MQFFFLFWKYWQHSTFHLVYARYMYKAAMNRTKQISWTLDQNITFSLIVKDIKLLFFLDKYTHIIKVKWKQIIHTWISSIDMKGFQNSFLVHYKMNFLLIFLTDKTSVRMESIYKTYKIWHFHSTQKTNTQQRVRINTKVIIKMSLLNNYDTNVQSWLTVENIRKPGLIPVQIYI